MKAAKCYWLILAACLWTACNTNPYLQGEALYTTYCASCHMEDGKGLKSLIPPLADSDYLKAQPLRTACIIRYGLNEPILVNGKSYDQPMDGIKALTDVEITNIINYINTAWSNDYGIVRLPDVQQELENCSN